MSRHASDDSFWSSYADLATGMMAIFLLFMAALTVALKVQQSEQEKRVDELSKQVQIILGTRARLAESIRTAFTDHEGVTADPVTAQVVFDEARSRLKFKEGDDSLSDDGQAFLEAFVPKYVCALRRQECGARPVGSSCGRLDPEAPNAVRRIIVTGHADLLGSPTQNFQLSAQRAETVVDRSLALLASPHSLTGTQCEGQHVALSQYAQERMVALGAGDVIHCRDRHDEIQPGTTCHQHPRRSAPKDQAEKGYRRVTFELELTGADMTGLVLDLIQLRQAVGIEDNSSTTNQDSLDSLEDLRDDIAPRCFEDPGVYQGCEAFIQACWNPPGLEATTLEAGIDCRPVESAPPNSALRAFIDRKAPGWERALQESESQP